MDASELLELQESLIAGAIAGVEDGRLLRGRYALKGAAKAQEVFTLDAPG